MFRNLCPGAVGIHVSFEESLALAGRFGFEGADLPIGMAADLLDKEGPEKLLDLYRKHSLRPGGWGFPVDWKGDEARWKEGMKMLPRWAKTGKALDCPWVPTWITPCSDDLTYEQNLQWHLARLSPAARILEDHGCRLGVEFVGTASIRKGHKHEFVYTLDQGLDLCKALGHNTGLLLDCWHWFSSGGTQQDLEKLKPGDVVYVHVNDAPPGIPLEERIDSDRDLPGATGVIDIASFLQRLSAIGYEGPVTAEPFLARLGTQPPEVSAKEVGESMKEIWRMAGIHG